MCWVYNLDHCEQRSRAGRKDPLQSRSHSTWGESRETWAETHLEWDEKDEMPILNEHMLDFISHSPAQTRRFGARLGGLLRVGDLVCLEGSLGTGKTCLVQGIGRGMGIGEPITSPTFTLIAEYQPPAPAPRLYHVDVYRLSDAPAEAVALGLEEYVLGDGVCVVEWADRVGDLLPEERLWISLRHVDQSKRGLTMTSSGMRYQELLGLFRKSAFGV
jgi:tRNA threonylcarbamoyladenosine biosynthesis protein TsaE